ncbi:hypothetical protein CRYUN_Cryun18bG0036000 [Craigia yunnanensis]
MVWTIQRKHFQTENSALKFWLSENGRESPDGKSETRQSRLGDGYGESHDNEIMLGKTSKQLPRYQIQLATKFGIIVLEGIQFVIKGTPEYVQYCCESSLKRLDVDYINLYYQHCVDTSVPIEGTIGELKKLVEEGKTKYIGLSEASVDTIRKAHAVHPITTLQMEYSLWTREIEDGIISLCCKYIEYCLPNLSLLPLTPICGIPLCNRECIQGTTKVKNIKENIGSLALKLTQEDFKELCNAVPIDDVSGPSEMASLSEYVLKFADTPSK